MFELVMRRVVGVLAVAGAVAGCSDVVDPSDRARTAETPRVYTVNYPLAFFAERIGGEAFEIIFPVPLGEDPAFWMPDADVVRAYQSGALILLNGATYAKWVDRVSLPASRLVNTSQGFSGELIRQQRRPTHSHGPEGEHAHGGTAFTTWLDFTLAARQAEAVKDALAGVCPSDRGAQEQRLAELKADLLGLDARMQRVADQIGNRPLLVSHPVYQYWARRYGLDVRALHWEPDETPTEEDWSELTGLLQGHPAELMVWEGEPLDATRTKLLERGLRPVVFDPCGNRPEQGDFLTVMRDNIRRLADAAQR